MKQIFSEHKKLWSHKQFRSAVFVGLILLVGSLLINYSSLRYVSLKAGDPASDVLLDILPVVNTDLIFSEGAVIFLIFIIILLILEPRRTPLIFKSVALFILIRSLFVMMTHIGPIPDRITTDFSSLKYLTSGADLFFSGHTGLPFMMALVFWDDKHLRWTFLAFSMVAAAAVLFGHLHYTIDVFSAFFISYGIYHMTLKFFPDDYQLSVKGPSY